MKLRIVTVSSRAPQWIQEGYGEYAKRVPREYCLNLVEVKPEARPTQSVSESTVARLKRAEAVRIRAHLADYGQVVALDETGRSFSTAALSSQLRQWKDEAQDVAFVIGGADGLDDTVQREASLRLSLSPMTLPHQLVRVVLVEQIYRALSLLHNHPYHRV